MNVLCIVSLLLHVTLRAIKVSSFFYVQSPIIFHIIEHVEPTHIQKIRTLELNIEKKGRNCSQSNLWAYGTYICHRRRLMWCMLWYKHEFILICVWARSCLIGRCLVQGLKTSSQHGSPPWGPLTLNSVPTWQGQLSHISMPINSGQILIYWVKKS